MGNLSPQGRKEYEARFITENFRISTERSKIAFKIVMAVVDKVVADIVRPGPVPEERECYEMAAELRSLVPDLEELVKKIIDVEDGVE